MKWPSWLEVPLGVEDIETKSMLTEKLKGVELWIVLSFHLKSQFFVQLGLRQEIKQDGLL